LVIAGRLTRLGSAAVLAWLLGGCAAPDASILITARTVAVPGATRIESIVVRVVPTASPLAPAPIRSEPVARTFAEVNGELPIHVAIHLQGPTPVMVHLVALTDGGDALYATRCYAPSGVITDEVLLVPGDPLVDVDGDGFPRPSDVDANCRDPGPGATGVACDLGLCPAAIAGDCDDSADAMAGACDRDHASEGRCIHPGADTFCGDGIDQDCRNNGGSGDDEPCVDLDGDGYSACAASARPDAGAVPDAGVSEAGVVDAGGPIDRGCDCNDTSVDVHPGATEVCGNAVDDDCSGEPGGMGAYCDADGDGFTSDVDCDDASANIHPGGLSLERCCDAPPCGADCECDGVDNNCNGLVDEHSSCAGPDLDGDGHDFCTAATPNCAECDCNDCDSGMHPGAVDACGNRIDEDGIADDAMCEASDVDRDGVVGGRDCAEGDPHTFLDAPEDCRTPASESCGTGTCGVDADMDGYGPTGPGVIDCDDTDPAIHPWATETCNGVNDDCDADGDEVLDPLHASGCVTDPSCSGSSRCRIEFASNIHHCGECRHECNPGTTLVADACEAGVCVCSTDLARAACDANETCCGETDAMGNPVASPGCDDLDHSTQNCGGCGIVCDRGVSSVCSGGACGCGAGAACTGGTACCATTSDADATCRDLQNDSSHCGACGLACGPNSTCSAGRCVCSDPDHDDCDGDLDRPANDGCETDLRADASHCGRCRESCTDDHVAVGSCLSGSCLITSCDALFDDCNGASGDGCEASLDRVDRCGGCGLLCAPAHADADCSTGSCGYGTCQSGFGDCDGDASNGCETALTADAHCGSCGNDCTDQNVVGGRCMMGSCTIASCASGHGNCDGSVANGCEAMTAGTAADCCGATCGSPPMCDARAMGAYRCH
jgi:hypothetical protein